jgi:ATP-dependent helicase YprA (DUF1998 family)
MRAFEFDHRLIDAYARFSRSFSTIRSDDLNSEINRQYDARRFWPDALLSLNPRYLEGPTVDDLVTSGDLDEATGRIFRFGSAPLRLHRHQAQSIAKARAGQSYVVTTGTGSGKSLCFFVPVVDAIVRAQKGVRRRTRRRPGGRPSPKDACDESSDRVAVGRGFLATDHDRGCGLQRLVRCFFSRVTSWLRF